MPQLPEVLNVLVLQRLPDPVLSRIKSIAPDRLNVIPGAVEFLPELQREWPAAMTQRFSEGGLTPTLTDEQREALVRDAHVIFAGITFPRTLPSRVRNLIWAHFGFAGTSNLKDSEWWGTPFITTSSRGYVAALPIAEAVIAGMFTLARKMDVAVLDTKRGVYDASNFGGIKLIGGKTMAIVGLGGIGAHVARLAKGVGMRIIATRRSAVSRQANVDGVDELFPVSETHAMLAEADFVAVCAMWTDETERMFDAVAFEAMKPGAYLLNIARGELIDSDAMAAALQSGRLAGAYLDVWDDDFNQPPPKVLQDAPNIIFTPHVSNRSDVPQMFAVDVFCSNLKRLLEGEALENAVDWERGY